MVDRDFRSYLDRHPTTPPQRTEKQNRWRRDSNRDEANPAFTPPLPPPPPDPNDPPPDPPPRKGMIGAGQTKRIIILFGDASFSMTMPGNLSSNARDIRRRLLEKSEMLGRFPADFHIERLRGMKRLVVLDVNEYNTSKNFSIPRLPHDHPVYPIRNVVNPTSGRSLYAVVTSQGMFDILHRVTFM